MIKIMIIIIVLIILIVIIIIMIIIMMITYFAQSKVFTHIYLIPFLTHLNHH